MKIIDPLETSHLLSFIPRLYPIIDIIFELYNEDTKEILTPANTYYISNGYLFISFDYTFTNKDRYQIKVYTVDDIIYRGKLFITD